MAQAFIEATEKAQKDAQEIKDLQETNDLLLERYQQNESLLQRFLSRAAPPATPPIQPSSQEAALQAQISRLQDELWQEQLTR